MEGLLQPTHLFFILLIVLIIFGPGKLPDLGRGLGKRLPVPTEGALKRRYGDPLGTVRSSLLFVCLFLGSSMVEHSAVNRRVPGSSPGRGANPPII